MTLFWFLIFLAVGIFSGFDLPTLEMWNAWSVTLLATVAWDISSD
jgi:hypothetical protein